MNKIKGLHINSVNIDGIWVHYNIEAVNGRMEIVARFVKDGEEIYKIHNICTPELQGVDMAAKLLDRDYAKKEGVKMIEESKVSKHSPFHKI